MMMYHITKIIFRRINKQVTNLGIDLRDSLDFRKGIFKYFPNAFFAIKNLQALGSAFSPS